MQNPSQTEVNAMPEAAAAPQAPAVNLTEAQAVANVTERLGAITEQAIRARRRSIAGGVGVGFCLITTLYAMYFVLNSSSPNAVPTACKVMLVVLFTLYLNAAFVYKTPPGFDAEELSRIGGVKAVVPLFSMLPIALSTGQRQTLYDVLTVLLPQMKASDANLLTPAARAAINGWLDYPGLYRADSAPLHPLRIAALKALEQVGDSTAIPGVERLTMLRPKSQNEKQTRQAASDCLPMLLINCGQVEAARTLLRASQPEDTRPDTLLRPASGTRTGDSKDLLRGADKP